MGGWFRCSKDMKGVAVCVCVYGTHNMMHGVEWYTMQTTEQHHHHIIDIYQSDADADADAVRVKWSGGELK